MSTLSRQDISNLGGFQFWYSYMLDGQTYYTRNGNFSWSQDSNGNTILATSEGLPVLDSRGNTIRVPRGVSSESMVFSSNGTIGYKDAVSYTHLDVYKRQRWIRFLFNGNVRMGSYKVFVIKSDMPDDSKTVANPEIKQLYINGHFCYVFKFGIILSNKSFNAWRIKDGHIGFCGIKMCIRDRVSPKQ